MSVHEVRVANLAGIELDVIDWTTLAYSDPLNDVGGAAFSVDKHDPKMALLLEGQREIHVYRDGLLVWGGRLWASQPQGSAPAVAFAAQGYFSVFDHRFIDDADQVFTGADQFDIAWDLIAYSQAKAFGALGITRDPAETPSGIQRTITYEAAARPFIGQLIRDLAGGLDGFDWSIGPDKVWRARYPTRGVQTAAVIELGKNVQDFSFPRDATGTRSATSALGGAQTSAKAFPATVVNSAQIGTEPWTMPGNAAASDNSRATVTLAASNPNSQYLKATGFGFAIPSDAHIDGIMVTVERQRADDDVDDNAVRLVKAGTILKVDRSSSDTWPDGTDATIDYGSASELWGRAWTPAEVNASGFGCAIAASRSSGDSSDPTAKVDSIAITVFFTVATRDASDPAVAAAFGLLEGTSSYADIADPDLLQGLADDDLLRFGGLLEQPTVVLEPADRDAFFGAFGVGDTVRLRIVDGFAVNEDAFWRVAEIRVEVAQTGQEKVTVAFDQRANGIGSRRSTVRQSDPRAQLRQLLLRIARLERSR